jgi:adenylate cyclase
MKPRGIRVKSAVMLLVMGGTILAALPLQWVWWRTANQSSIQLVSTLSEQISSTVRREWWDRVVAAESAYAVAEILLDRDVDEGTVTRALTAALAATPVPSAVAFDMASGGRIVGRRNAAGSTETVPSGAVMRVEAGVGPKWRDDLKVPLSDGPAVAYAGSVRSAGLLSVYIGAERFSMLLQSIPVGRTGGAFVIGPDGAVRIMPSDAVYQALKGAVEAAGAVVAARPADAKNAVESRRILVDGAGYQVSLSPLEFRSWQFAVIVPEAEFLSDIQRTTLHTMIGLLALALALGVAVAYLAQRVLADPVAALTGDLARIERFELEEVGYRPGPLREFDRLSAAIARMATGLADFGKFIPTELVRMLLADGVRAAPGGETRELTLMFADVAGFTKLSERLGTGVIDIVSRYLDLVSRAVETNGGTVDKFIGDAVMAFWGAPRDDAEQARNACAAALAAIAAVREAGIVDDQGTPLRIRIGLHTGAAVVGNIGSERRLNYTAIGDSVNLASRLEGANKVFGTTIIVSDATRRLAGATFVTRELADVSVLGKSNAVLIHELIGSGGDSGKPDWAKAYEEALAAYRDRRFAEAARLLDGVLQLRPDDGPSLWLKGMCETFRNTPPPPDWNAVSALDQK